MSPRELVQAARALSGRPGFPLGADRGEPERDSASVAEPAYVRVLSTPPLRGRLGPAAILREP